MQQVSETVPKSAPSRKHLNENFFEGKATHAESYHFSKVSMERNLAKNVGYFWYLKILKISLSFIDKYNKLYRQVLC